MFVLQVVHNPLESEAVKAVAADVEKRLEGKGRILLRKSGTEPLYSRHGRM